ncbi:BrnT family toxin [Verminephrobacter aporrectodeae]|uniref:BrnT family toxin n=1 Tax=Verminephrobacter aporrectodeae TaxID=1110389 RepID=UPI00023753E8|nr:BrnT family toxin [Verminephrobacter aporrectodeae]
MHLFPHGLAPSGGWGVGGCWRSPTGGPGSERARGLPFSLVEPLDWSDAVIEENDRKDYGERRFRVLGFIRGRLHAMVFTPRAGKVHVISLRKANQREVRKHAQENQA